jgi:hypothetical protein
MNIHLPAILMFTRGIGFWPIPMFVYQAGYPILKETSINGDKPRDFTSKTAASPLQLINDGPLIRQSLAEMAGLGTQQPLRGFRMFGTIQKLEYIVYLIISIYVIIYIHIYLFIYLSIYLCVCVLIHTYQYVYTYIYNSIELYKITIIHIYIHIYI